MNRQASVTMAGNVGFRVVRVARRPSFWSKMWAGIFGGDRSIRSWKVRNIPNLLRGAWRYAIAALFNLPTILGELSVRVIKADGTIIDYGLVSLRVVTDAGVGFIVDAFQNSVELENMKYHGLGTGTGNEAAGDTALGTELTTEYETDNTRATGDLGEGASANIFKTIATNLINSGTPAVTEHGIFSQAANSGGVLLDRSKFAAINLASGDSIQSTYQLTFTAGS